MAEQKKIVTRPKTEISEKFLMIFPGFANKGNFALLCSFIEQFTVKWGFANRIANDFIS